MTRPPPPPPVRIGLLGCGTVGSAVAGALLDRAALVGRAAETDVELARVAVAHPLKRRSVRLPRGVLTGDALAVVCDPGIDVVVEAIGGIEPAKTLIEAALADGKSVVSANKELLAVYGPALAAAADRKGVHLLYEAAACAGIPVVRCIRESLAGSRILRITGILNGTTNYVLGEMQDRGSSLADALAAARERGVAEADPSADVDGRDAAAKATLLARLASGAEPVVDRVEGIRAVTPAEAGAARRSGRSLKLVARVDLSSGEPRVTVGVESLPETHPLAGVGGIDNAVEIETQDGARLFFSGPGAGGDATALAILGDLVQIARERARARAGKHLVCA